MSRRRAVKVALVVVVLLGCLVIGRRMFGLPPVPSHRGDGTVEDLCGRTGPVAIRGYSISMREFDLSNPHQADNHLAGLADIGLECGVYLAIRDHDNRLWGDARHLDGGVQLELLDSRQRSVVS